MSSLEWSSRSIPGLAPVVPLAPPAKPLVSGTEILVGLGALALVGAANLAVDRGDQPIYSNASTVAAKTSTRTPQNPGGSGQTEAHPKSATTTTSSSAPAQSDANESGAASVETGEDGEQAATTTQVDPTQRVVLSEGTLHLRGAVPSQEAADTIRLKAEAALGAGNVVSEYTVDPSVSLSPSTSIMVENAVHFEFGSAKTRAEFGPLLDLSVALMKQDPKVRITVTGHTDSVGSAEFNQGLSEARTASVVQYLLDSGITEDQIISISRGERSPIADNSTPEGAQANRRVELTITGLLG